MDSQAFQAIERVLLGRPDSGPRLGDVFGLALAGPTGILRRFVPYDVHTQRELLLGNTLMRQHKSAVLTYPRIIGQRSRVCHSAPGADDTVPEFQLAAF